MVMKDWEETFHSDYSIVWKSSKNPMILEVQQNMRGHWSFWVGKNQVGKTTTKSQAISLARSYMRTH